MVKAKLSRDCLCALLLGGVNKNQIAKQCGLSRQAVSFKAKNFRKGSDNKFAYILGEKSKDAAASIAYLAYKNHTAIEIAKELSLSVAYIYRVLRKYKINYNYIRLRPTTIENNK